MELDIAIPVPTVNNKLRVSRTVYPKKHSITHLSWWVRLKMIKQEIDLSNGLNPDFAKSSTQFAMEYLQNDAKLQEQKLNHEKKIKNIVSSFFNKPYPTR